jgi:hypothetical protein
MVSNALIQRWEVLTGDESVHHFAQLCRQLEEWKPVGRLLFNVERHGGQGCGRLVLAGSGGGSAGVYSSCC